MLATAEMRRLLIPALWSTHHPRRSGEGPLLPDPRPTRWMEEEGPRLVWEGVVEMGRDLDGLH